MTVTLTNSTVSVSSMSLDHPGWLRDSHGLVRRTFRSGNTVWTAICESDHLRFEPAIEADTAAVPPLVDWFDPASLPAFFRAAVPLRSDTPVQRVRNPDLWDALLPPILHQRRRTDDVDRMYHRFCVNHGSVITTTTGATLLPPTPETVAALPDDAFIKLGMRDKRKALRAAAEACLTRAHEWAQLSPAELLTELQTVSRVGPWTAGAVVADITNDHSFYAMPVDMAYRQWNEFLAPPSAHLPEHDFTQAWATLTRPHRSTMTALILAAPPRRRTADHLAGEAKNARP